MMKTVKHTFSSIGDHGGDVARAIGAETALLARRFGSGTVTVARQVGPRRGLIGLAVLAAAIGGSVMLIRYLKARAAEAGVDDETAEPGSQRVGGGKRARDQRTADARISH
jgi:hypothetical protein